MQNLSAPSKKTVSRILNEVEFQDRLIGSSLHERAGAMPISLYSFEEVFVLLNGRNPRIDFNQLETWIRNIMEDRELAARIKKVIEQEQSDRDKSLRIRDLMGLRLIQCRQAV